MPSRRSGCRDARGNLPPRRASRKYTATASYLQRSRVVVGRFSALPACPPFSAFEVCFSPSRMSLGRLLLESAATMTSQLMHFTGRRHWLNVPALESAR